MRINLEYDTVTKELRFTKNGVESDKLESLSCYHRYEERDGKKLYAVDFSEVTSEDNEKDGTRKVTRENTMAALAEAMIQEFPKEDE